MIAVEPGKRVAVLSLRPGSRDGQVTFATIKTVGKRDIVLDDGQRFSVARQQRHDGGTWGPLALLCDVDDPRVVSTLRRQRIQNMSRRIEAYAAGVGSGRSTDPAQDTAKLAELAARLQELVGLPQATEQAAP